jgi:hypothetical protein
MKFDDIMKENTAKKYLSEKAFSYMDADRIRKRDPKGEIKSWLIKIDELTK